MRGFLSPQALQEVERIKNALSCSEAEARLIAEDDKRIDRGEKLFELAGDRSEVANLARKSGQRRTVYTFTKRARKVNNEKREIIEALRGTVAEETEILNPEREFQFIRNGVQYKVTLSCPRK